MADSQAEVLDRIDDAVRMQAIRRRFLGEELKFGPNLVHAYIGRGESGAFGRPGSFEDLGWSHNLKTTIGMDWLHDVMGGRLPAGGIGSPNTAVTATSITATGTPWTVNQLAGFRVVSSVTGITTSPVYGNIVSNTSSVATIDQWWTGADAVGTTPAAANGFSIVPGGLQSARFIGITTNVAAPAVGDTALTGEETTGGLARALATYAHTGGAVTFTLSKTFAASATFTNEHKCGLFTSLTGTGILVADPNLNADATLASGDSLAITWTWTLPAAG